MRVSSDEIRAYVGAQAKIAKQALPDESRRVVFRMPTDSVDITPTARALQKGRLSVRLDDDGRFTEVTNDNSSPVMQLLDEGMSDVKQHLDKMRELTELMEDEKLSVEDRYATQMKLVELEGELEKTLHALNEEYQKLADQENLPGERAAYPLEAEGQANVKDMLRTGKFPQQGGHALTDRATGEVFAYGDFNAMIDKRTELKKEAIKRVMMRELDPEAWAEYEEKLRETLREEFKNGASPDSWLMNAETPGAAKPEYRDIPPDAGAAKGAAKDVPVPETAANVEFDPAAAAELPIAAAEQPPMIDIGEYNMEKYVEERLAEIEKADYEEFNAMRVSVMSAPLAEESGDYLEQLTNRLTEQYQSFAANNEIIGEEDMTLEPEEQAQKRKKIADIARDTMNHLFGVLFDNIQKDATREKSGYDLKIEKKPSPMDGVRDLSAMIGEASSEYWQRLRPDLFTGASAGA